MTEEQELEQFLKELTLLSIKYGIYIDGCGCCGSPFLRVSREGECIDDGEIIAECLGFDEQHREYWVSDQVCSL